MEMIIIIIIIIIIITATPGSVVTVTYRNTVFVCCALEPGERVRLQPYDGGSTQQWAVEGKLVKNRSTGEVLDIAGESHADNAEVCSYSNKNQKNQHWRVEYVK